MPFPCPRDLFVTDRRDSIAQRKGRSRRTRSGPHKARPEERLGYAFNSRRARRRRRPAVTRPAPRARTPNTGSAGVGTIGVCFASADWGAQGVLAGPLVVGPDDDAVLRPVHEIGDGVTQVRRAHLPLRVVEALVRSPPVHQVPTVTRRPGTWHPRTSRRWERHPTSPSTRHRPP